MGKRKGTTLASGTSTARSVAEKLEAQLSAARQIASVVATIRSVRTRYPELFEELKDEIRAAIDADPSDLAAEDESAPLLGERREFAVDKMIAFFKDRDNKASSIIEMATALGLSQKSIKGALYMRNKELFEAVPERGRNNRAFYRLVDSGADI